MAGIGVEVKIGDFAPDVEVVGTVPFNIFNRLKQPLNKRTMMLGSSKKTGLTVQDTGGLRAALREPPQI